MGDATDDSLTAVEFIRKRPSMYFAEVPPTAEQLVDLLVADARQWRAQVTLEQVGRFSVVHGSPDWLAPIGEAWFRLFGTGPELIRQPVFITAVAAVVVTKRRGERLLVIAGSLKPTEEAALLQVGQLSERVVAFAPAD